MSYFDNDYVSNSDLKAAMAKANGKVEPENLQEIFDAGTLNHQALLEPHKAQRWFDIRRDQMIVAPKEEIQKLKDQYALAKAMAETVLKDSLCRQLIMMPDFRREHEWYRSNIFDLKGARCKTDGDSKMLSTIFEYKGLAVTSENQFEAALLHHDYDQSAHWYLDVVGYKNYLIVGVSKKNPKLLFKRLITRDHDMYHSGGVKVELAIRTWKQFGFE